MRARAWGWGAAVAAVVIIAAIVVGRGAPRASHTAAAPQGNRRPVPLVVVGHPRTVALPRTLQLTATITSLRQSVIFPKTSGYLQDVTVRPGDAVRPGQVLALIDHGQLDAQVAQAQASLSAAESAVQTARAQVAAARAQRLNAEAGLTSARAAVVKAQAELADMQSTYNRSAALAKQGAIAQQSLDDAKAQVLSAQATLDASRAQVGQAQAQVDAAREQEAAAASQVKTAQAQAATQAAALDNTRVQLQYATVVAPFAGVVVSRQLDPGAYVTPGTSTSIVTIADLDHLDVVLNSGEATLPMLHQGDPVQVTVDAYPGQVFRGVISRIAGGVDPTTRTIQVEVDIPNPAHLLRPGMYATAQLSAGSRQSFVVPLTAVQTLGTQHYVWVIEDGKASQQNVNVGQATGEVVEITGGLQPTDTVVVSGVDLVRQGQPVRTAPAAAAGTP
ncbi:MAG TPA: efflux RND transporter periplasmic adaptor subunit [bacterium]|nr:efflux RND transporter periplasmic adaptor subunit [bacterium]